MIRIAPSLLAADFSCLAPDIRRAYDAGGEELHIDVMDGNFVPPITLGAQMVSALRPHSPAYFDVHLMVNAPALQVEAMAASGAQCITIHVEASGDTAQTLALIRSMGIDCGITLNPDTPCEAIFPYLPQVDRVLVMSVVPGYGGQAYIPESTGRIRCISREITRRGLNIPIEVDGGINPATARLAVDAGASILVAGSYLFGAENMAMAMEALRL